MSAWCQGSTSSVAVLEQSKALFPYIRNSLAVIGAVYVVKTILQEACILINGFHAYVLAPKGLARTNLRKYGEWAVVTGASGGIGRGYALELAKQGFDVVIMSRSQEKLQKVADEIRSLYGRTVLIIPVDFTDGQQVYKDIANQLAGLDIGILVNNVGLSYRRPDYFLKVPQMMTYMLLPKMLEKKRGVIVNLSSVSAVKPRPSLVTYAATKKFICFFSDGIRSEYGNKGILVQTVSPGTVTTTMSGAFEVDFITPDPVSYATSAVATIGIQNFTHGHWGHALQMYVACHLRYYFWHGRRSYNG